MSLKSRVQKVEAVIGKDSGEEGARDVVSFMQEVGAIEKGVDTAPLVADFSRAGLSMRSLLKEIDGQTVGPPGLRHGCHQRPECGEHRL